MAEFSHALKQQLESSVCFWIQNSNRFFFPVAELKRVEHKTQIFFSGFIRKKNIEKLYFSFSHSKWSNTKSRIKWIFFSFFSLATSSNNSSRGKIPENRFYCCLFMLAHASNVFYSLRIEFEKNFQHKKA